MPSRSRWPRMLRLTLASLGLALLATALIPAAAQATIARAMAMRDLVTEADVIARVTVIGRSARRDDLDRIVTDVTVRIDEALYASGDMTGHVGSARAGDEIVVTRLGGELDGLGLRVEGEPGLPQGAEVLLFAAVSPRGTLRPVGMSQGVFPIARDTAGRELAMPNGDGLSLVAPTGAELTESAPALARPAPIDALLDEVRALIVEVHGGR
jgi:hypothetical protein